MKAIEQIYENYKASQNEETPYSEEQKREFDKLSVTLDKVFPGEIQEDYRKQQQIFDNSVAHCPICLEDVIIWRSKKIKGCLLA